MKIVIAGDYCPRGRVGELIEKGKFSSIFEDVKSITSGKDYAIVNLECPVVENKTTPIKKCGPNLGCSCKSVQALKWAGFDCVTLANNHFYDYGEKGVFNTVNVVNHYGLDYVGGGKNLGEASRVLYKEFGESKLAIVNCCEHEFSIATDTSAGSNPLNIVQQYYAIREAKNNATNVIVIVHGGVEHYWLPSPRMKETYRFFIDAGADAVINHHQHCYSGYEVYKKKPIFYGLGNFCFDGNKGNKRWTTGYLVNLNLSENTVDFELIPYRQCYEDEIGVHLLMQDDRNVFFETIKQYNSIIVDDSINNMHYLNWCEERENLYKLALNPFYNRFTKFFFDSALGRGLFKKRWLYSKDMIENESHVERLRMTVNNMIKSRKV